MSGWHFVGIPKKDSEEIKKLQKVRGGFGSVPVMVTLGISSWKTSIFPDKRTSTYLLPIKAAIRKKEGVYPDDKISFTIQLV